MSANWNRSKGIWKKNADQAMGFLGLLLVGLVSWGCERFERLRVYQPVESRQD